MKKSTTRKKPPLKLAHETIRLLEDRTLIQVVGGAQPPTRDCTTWWDCW